MIDTIENSRTEFKIKLVDDLEETVIAFLNKDGGNIYIGVDDNGKVVGLKNSMDLFQRKVKEAGKLRIEGKDYIMQDGDICYFRFNV